MIRKVELERLTVISTRPFEDVVAAIRSSVGNPDMAAFGKAVTRNLPPDSTPQCGLVLAQPG